ncbi:hypothetical protein SALBM311S_09769 [Streptomyces alboniger]
MSVGTAKPGTRLPWDDMGSGLKGRTPVRPGRRTEVSLGGPTGVMRLIRTRLSVEGFARAGPGCRRTPVRPGRRHTQVSPERVRTRTRRCPEIRTPVSPGPIPPARRTGRRTRPPIRICRCRRTRGNRRTRGRRRQGRHLGLSRRPGRSAGPASTCTARPRWPGRSGRLSASPANLPRRGPKTARRPRRTTDHPHHRHPRRRGDRSGDGTDPAHARPRRVGPRHLEPGSSGPWPLGPWPCQ